MDGGMMDGPGPWMFFPMVFWVLILVGIIFTVVWAVQKTSGTDGRKTEESAIEVLKKRYARGEITKEEFENIKKDIT